VLPNDAHPHQSPADTPSPADECRDVAPVKDLGALVEALRPDLLRRVQALRDSLGGVGMSATDLAHASVERFLAAAQRDGAAPLTRGEAWGLLSTIAQHLFIDSLRRRTVHQSALERLRHDRAAAGDAAESEPARSAERRDLAEHTLSAMTEEEQLLVARRMQGAAWASIAAEVGVSEEALRQRWSALRRRLRSLAEGDD
jgi:DNA-directed RNA polymerase specialized sigma24 family protein